MNQNISFLKSLVFAIIIALLFMKPSSSFAQTSGKINWNRMQRDLDIMENILDKLIAPSHFAISFGRNQTLGVYFEGYGVVFQVNSNDNRLFYLSHDKNIAIAKELIELKARTVHEDEEKNVVTVITEPDEKASQAGLTERIKELKDSLTEFLGDYSDAIGQLKETDRVTVLVNLGNDEEFVLAGGYNTKDNEKAISMLEVTVPKSNIIEYRRGRINKSEFRQRVAFHERAQDDKMRKNLDIMANIMNTALNKKYNRNFSAEGKTKGIYLKGLGVLFFMKGNLEENGFRTPIHIYVDEYRKGEEVAISRKDREQKSKKKVREALDEYKKALVEVVGDYGHTLRTLKPAESVVVAVNFNKVWNYREEVPNRFILKVRKQDLDTYSRGNLNLADFRKKVEFIEY